MHFPAINYVIACWSGRRRHSPPDCTLYLRTHLEHLVHYEHKLSQVTFVVPHNPQQPPEFTALLERLPRAIGAAHVEVLERPNVGLSYGSYSDAFGRFGDAFDYYIFMEDDYVFVQHRFDEALVEMFCAIPDCGYLAGLVWHDRGLPHGAISNGITSSVVLSEVWQAHGELPHSPSLGARYDDQQIHFTQAFLIGNRRLCDVTKQYHVLFNAFGTNRLYGDPEKPLLMRPIEHR